MLQTGVAPDHFLLFFSGVPEGPGCERQNLTFEARPFAHAAKKIHALQ
jgi:hypothetical protein